MSKALVVDSVGQFYRDHVKPHFDEWSLHSKLPYEGLVDENHRKITFSLRDLSRKARRAVEGIVNRLYRSLRRRVKSLHFTSSNDAVYLSFA